MRTLAILLVDDSPAILDSVERFLNADKRIRIVGRASNGVEALALNAHYRPAVVLMDITMPVMDGLDATRHLKSLSAAPQVILMSIHDAAGYVEAALAAGADAFVTKARLARDLPVVLAPLLARMNATLRRSPAHRLEDQP